MTTDFITSEDTSVRIDDRPLLHTNPFLGQECLLKKCCKKYKKGKRCKKCPD